MLIHNLLIINDYDISLTLNTERQSDRKIRFNSQNLLTMNMMLVCLTRIYVFLIISLEYIVCEVLSFLSMPTSKAK